MKILKLSGVLLLTTLPVTIVFALNHHCPPAEVIKKVKFTKVIAKKYGRWSFYSAPFSYDNKEWNIHYEDWVPFAKNDKEALKRVEEILPQLEIPQGREVKTENKSFCHYGNITYTLNLNAFSPPEY